MAGNTNFFGQLQLMKPERFGHTKIQKFEHRKTSLWEGHPMANTIESVINKLSPDSHDVPAEQIAEVVMSATTDPSPAALLADLETMLAVIKEVRVKLAGVHPTILNMFKALI